MDVTSKILDINNALDELKKSQRQIWRRLSGDVYRSSPDQPTKQLENLEKTVFRIEKQFDRHLNSLEETRRLFFELIKQVDTISSVVEKLQNSVKSEYKTSNSDFYGHESDNHNGWTTPTQTNFLTEHMSNCKNKSGKSDEISSITSVKPLEQEECLNCDDVRTQSNIFVNTQNGKALSLDSGESRTIDNHNKRGLENRTFENHDKESSESNHVSATCSLSGENLHNLKNTLKTSNDDVNYGSIPNQVNNLNEKSYGPGDDRSKNILKDEASVGLATSQKSSPAIVKLQTANRETDGQGLQEQCTNKAEHTKTRKQTETKPKRNLPADEVRQCKNDFGYKQKRSEMWSDNRVAYHCKGKCFEGIATHPSDPPPNKSQPSQNIEHKRKSVHINRKTSMNKPREFTQLHEMLQGMEEEYNPAIGKPRNIKEWFAFAEQLRVNSLIRMQSGAVRRSRRGHDWTLVLDCSEHMRGQKFDVMIKAAKEYVNGIRQVQMTRLLEDNIALAIFGGNSRLIVETTCDYDLILSHIDKLQPEGEAPVVGGLLMGLAGVLGAGATSQILDNEVPGHMIVLTDKSSADVVIDTIDPSTELYINPSYITGDFLKHAELGGVISKIAGYSIKIYYVPIGEQSNPIMETAVKETNGKTIKITEMYRLVRMTQVLMTSAQIASELRRSQPNPSREVIRQIVMHSSSHPDGYHDDCIDLVLEFINPLATEMRRGMYVELSCKSFSLGTRVRRGPDWVYEDQDSDLPGTIIGEENDHSIWVEWDNGVVNTYIYDERKGIRTIKAVPERRRLIGEMIAVGCRVIRGINWEFGNDDGGPGCLGTILAVRKNGTVVVRWDCRKIGNYNIGRNGLIEVQVCEDGPLCTDFPSVPTIFGTENVKYTENTTEKQGLDTTGKNKVLEEGPDTFENYVIPTDPKTQVNAVWEHKGGSNWEQFSSELNCRIEKAYLRKPSGKSILQMEKETFIIYFDKMLMENTKTKDQFAVRRTVEST